MLLPVLMVAILDIKKLHFFKLRGANHWRWSAMQLLLHYTRAASCSQNALVMQNRVQHPPHCWHRSVPLLLHCNTAFTIISMWNSAACTYLFLGFGARSGLLHQSSNLSFTLVHNYCKFILENPWEINLNLTKPISTHSFSFPVKMSYSIKSLYIHTRTHKNPNPKVSLKDPMKSVFPHMK